jgi:hypothetical protein
MYQIRRYNVSTSSVLLAFEFEVSYGELKDVIESCGSGLWHGDFGW